MGKRKATIIIIIKILTIIIIIIIIMGGMKGDFEPGRVVSLVIIVVEKGTNQRIVFITRTLPSAGYLETFILH